MVKATTKQPKNEMLRPQALKGYFVASYVHNKPISCFDPCQFRNPRNCPPQAPNMYVYAYIVHFEPTRGEGGHPIIIGGASVNNWGGVRGIVVDVSI